MTLPPFLSFVSFVFFFFFFSHLRLKAAMRAGEGERVPLVVHVDRGSEAASVPSPEHGRGAAGAPRHRLGRRGQGGGRLHRGELISHVSITSRHLDTRRFAPRAASARCARSRGRTEQKAVNEPDRGP